MFLESIEFHEQRCEKAQGDIEDNENQIKSVGAAAQQSSKKTMIHKIFQMIYNAEPEGRYSIAVAEKKNQKSDCPYGEVVCRSANID